MNKYFYLLIILSIVYNLGTTLFDDFGGQRFALCVLDEEIPSSIPGKTNLGISFSKLVLVWVFWEFPV